MGKTLYLECENGISGDMTVAALIDLGADSKGLVRALQSIPAEGCRIELSRVKKAGLSCMDFNVILDEEHENHDHDMEYLYGHIHGDHEHEHHHEHDHEHSHEHGHHHHRGLTEIKEIIAKTDISDGAKSIAVKIFEIIAEAEAKAHGETIENVHFHEVGAIDSIVDIIAIAYCIDDLDIDKVIVPYLCEGKGTVRCQHGILPIPVPAVASIVESFDIPIKPVSVDEELVTPTGAAAVAALRTSDTLPEMMIIKKTGMGAGKRDGKRAGILRAHIIEDKSLKSAERIVQLETNIDDCTGENLGFVMERLFEAGARDAYFVPVYMKKNRPAYLLSVICDADKKAEMETIIFRETTTIGIREYFPERHILPRERIEIETSYGKMLFKRVTLPNGEERVYPEFEYVRKKAIELGVPFETVMSELKVEKC